MYVQTPIDPYLDRLAKLHQRLCPRQVLGVRIGQLAGELLGLEFPRADKRLFAFVEISPIQTTQLWDAHIQPAVSKP